MLYFACLLNLLATSLQAAPPMLKAIQLINFRRISSGLSLVSIAFSTSLRIKLVPGISLTEKAFGRNWYASRLKKLGLITVKYTSAYEILLAMNLCTVSSFTMLRKVFLVWERFPCNPLCLVCISTSNMGTLLDNVKVKFLASRETSKAGASSQNQVTVGVFQHFYHHCNVLFENAVRERFLLLLSGEGHLFHCCYTSNMSLTDSTLSPA